MREGFKESRVVVGELNSQIEDSLLGVRVVKSFANEKIEQKKFKEIFGSKKVLETQRLYRQTYLLNIDYDDKLAFDTEWIIGDGAGAYVGDAIVGATYII